MDGGHGLAPGHPASSLIVDGYVRVSHVGERSGERFISPAVQRQQIEAWARSRGFMLGQVFEELDESGARADRPLLEEAIARVERGESHGIVVAKIDRFGRSLVDGIAAIERVTAAGGVFASVQDGLDLSTDTGRLILRIMLSMAEWELDRVRTNWDVACARAIARGVHVGGAPYGYVRKRDGRLGVDPATGPHVTEMFKMRASGTGTSLIRRHLEDVGVEPSAGGGWKYSTLRQMLRNRVYLGEVRWGRYVNAGSHAPLTDPVTFVAAQQPRQGERSYNRVGTTLLHGLLRCAGCGRVMTTCRARPGGTVRDIRYICKTEAPPCPAKADIRDHMVEPYVEALFWQELPKVKSRGPRRTRALEAQIAEREHELARYRDNPRLLEALGAERFERGVDVRMRRIEKAMLELARAQRQSDVASLPRSEALRDIWPTLDIGERRLVVGEVFDCFFVFKTGKRAPVVDRLHPLLRGKASPDLPAIYSHRVIAPFKPENAPPPVTLSKARDSRWSERRLRAALDPLVAGRDTWPFFQEFQDVGLGLVWPQLDLHGGERRWAVEYGLKYIPNKRNMSASDEQEIRHQLSRMLTGRTDWPGERELTAFGGMRLGNGIRSHGGREYWAAEFGVELSPNQRGPVPRWTDEQIESALRALAKPGDPFPTCAEIDAAGRGLDRAIGTGPKRIAWARRLGLKPDGRSRHCVYTDARIKRDLKRLLRRRRTYPTQKDFIAADQLRLYQAIGRSALGHRGWAARLEAPWAGRSRPGAMDD